MEPRRRRAPPVPALAIIAAIAALAWLIPAVHGQMKPDYSTLSITGLYRRDFPVARDAPNWAYSRMVNGTLRTVVLAEHQQCHANMSYVVRSSNSPRYLPRLNDGGLFYSQAIRDVVLGCCDVGTFGCTVPSVDHVLGCCPIGKHCVLKDDTRHGVSRPFFVGCADHVSQDCGGRYCAPGFICCPGSGTNRAKCAPGTPDQPLEEVCGPPTSVRPKLHVQTAHVRDYQVYERGGPPATGPSSIELIDGFNSTAFVADGFYLCHYSRQRCRIGLDHCSLHVDTFTDTVNGTVVVVGTKTRAVHCCPLTFEACTVSNRDFREPAVGCADVVAGEQCCGAQICPAGQQCCSGPPSGQPNGGGPSTPFCCSQWETCCYSSTYGAYCGKMIAGDPCGADSRAPPHWWSLRPPNL